MERALDILAKTLMKRLALNLDNDWNFVKWSFFFLMCTQNKHWGGKMLGSFEG